MGGCLVSYKVIYIIGQNHKEIICFFFSSVLPTSKEALWFKVRGPVPEPMTVERWQAIMVNNFYEPSNAPHRGLFMASYWRFQGGMKCRGLGA